MIQILKIKLRIFLCQYNSAFFYTVCSIHTKTLFLNFVLPRNSIHIFCSILVTKWDIDVMSFLRYVFLIEETYDNFDLQFGTTLTVQTSKLIGIAIFFECWHLAENRLNIKRVNSHKYLIYHKYLITALICCFVALWTWSTWLTNLAFLRFIRFWTSSF